MKLDQLSNLLAFNYSVVDYLDASWFSEVEHSDLLQALAEQDVSKPWISSYFLEIYQLDSLPDFEFDNLLKNIVLQSRGILIQVIFYAGLILNHTLFRQVIKRTERKALETCLGESNYQFAVKRAPLMSGQLSSLFPCQFVIDWKKSEDIKKHIFRSGIRLLGAVFSNESDGYKKRLLFKFPVPSQEYFYAGCAEKNVVTIQKLGSALFKKLLKEFG